MSEKPQMMKCGCVAQGTCKGKPVCVIHDCFEIAPEPILEGRTSVCTDCDNEQPSNLSLPFFVHQPDKPKDNHYCGCKGWN